jgi:hypothetical protein
MMLSPHRGILWAFLAAAALAPAAGPATTSAPASPGLVVFARSGGPKGLLYRLPEGASPKAVVLRAFGRTWIEPAAVADGQAEIRLPAVRVPTLFAVTAEGKQEELGQILAYPSAPQPPWKGRVCLAGAPSWLLQWTDAAGLDASTLAPGRLDEPAPAKAADEKALLVLGAVPAGKGMAGFLRLARRPGMGMLVLEADWFGPEDRPAQSVAVGPRQMGNALAAVHSQHWGGPLTFASRRRAWTGTCNRLAWIAGEDGPLVEELFLPGAARRVVLSYLPWWQQLGRRDVADATLLGVFSAVAEPMDKAPTFNCGIELLHPPAAQVKADERPVLAAALALQAKALPSAIEKRACVLDLRGPNPPPEALLAQIKKRQDDFSRECPLLVLGDDPVLGQWDWLKLDREKMVARTPHVTWLAEDDLPPSKAAQLELMQAMTRLGIPLWDDKQEKDHETDAGKK